jgi:hypothetical protein
VLSLFSAQHSGQFDDQVGDAGVLDGGGAKGIVGAAKIRRHAFAWICGALLFLMCAFRGAGEFVAQPSRQYVLGVRGEEGSAIGAERKDGADFLDHGATRRAGVAEVTAQGALADPGFFVKGVLGQAAFFHEDAKLAGELRHGYAFTE